MSASKELRRAETAISKAPPLSATRAATARDLADAGRLRTYRKGTYLCHQGEPATDVFFLVRGRVEVSGDSATGTRVYHATVDTPQFLGELGPFGEMDLTASIVALVDSQVWIGPAEAFLEAVAGEPASPGRVVRARSRGRSRSNRRSWTTSFSST